MDNNVPSTEEQPYKCPPWLTPLPSAAEPKLKLSLRGTNFTIPLTTSAAEHLLHLVRSHQDTCELQRKLVMKRLHEATLYLQALREEVNIAEHEFEAAAEDVGTVRAALRTSGLKVSFAEECSYCLED